METYNVILHKGVDYQSFWDDMELSDDGGTLHIPNRRVDSPNLRPNSPRQAWYTLSAEEVTTLKNDNRVKGVEIPPEFRDDIIIEHRATQDGNFSKTTSDSGEYINWGLVRHMTKKNPWGASDIISKNYTYTLDGSNVDIVIQDSGVQFDHPEFKGPDGVERTVTIDWYSLSGVTGTQNANHNRDLDGHGTHVAGIAAGINHGVAKNASVYFVKVSGLEGSTDGSTGISTTDCFDVIKGWHNSKVDNPLTGVPNPTIVNMSWGYLTTYTDASITAINYRGVSSTGTDINTTTKREENFGLNNNLYSAGTYAANLRILSVDTDVEEMIDAGIHVTIAAGNRGNKCDVPGGTDYNNYYTSNGTDQYYHRGSSPNADGAILVGNLDSSYNAATNADGSNKDQKAFSSECGPAVDLYAAGTNVMSCTSNTNKFSDSAYYFDNNYRQCNISGTSMAAPQVAGMAALLLQQAPQSPPKEIKATLQNLSGITTLYTSSANNDWTDRRSLLGGEPKIMFNKQTNSKPTIIKNVPSGFFQGGVKITTK
ncbi:S8 family serine peptidase [bacterium]|nr:S8 family serine peptidase [bacterium]